MCTKGTPARVRLSCHCSHVMMGGGGLVAVLLGLFIWSHIWQILAVVAFVTVLTVGFVIGLRRLSARLTPMAVLVYHPHEVDAPAAVRPARAAAPVAHAFVPLGWHEGCGHLDHPQANRCFLPARAHAPARAAGTPSAADVVAGFEAVTRAAAGDETIRP